jgi:neutral ceramidase
MSARWAGRMRLAGAAILSLLGCVPGKPLWTVAPASAPSSPPTGEAVLHAGIGRADITPPPGLGLAGSGTEGKESAGYRTRLYARAILLQDPVGEKLALVVADLPHISLLLHREVARRIQPLTGIGADRLILSATHTHAGPGHFYETHQLNGITSRVPGYDTTVVNFLAQAIAASVAAAAGDLRPARLAWGATSVWGHTRNRMYDAFRRNAPRLSPFAPVPPGLDPARQAVNPVWTMVRVEVRDPGSPREGPFRPAAAYSVFAMHGTGNTAENDLYDGDIHALVERGLERHIDSLNGAGEGVGARSVHAFANGTVGDVSPDWPAHSRCPVPRLRPQRRPAGPRTPESWGWQHGSPSALGRCEAAARGYVNALGDTLARRAVALFDSLAGGRSSDTVRIGVAFRTLALADSHQVLGVCPSPKIGNATAAGSDDAVSRFRGLRLFGVLPLGLEQEKSAVRRDPRGCHAEKKTLPNLFTVRHAFPEHAQVSVIRIGDLLLGTLPGEPTTMAGVAASEAMLGAAAAGGRPASVAVVLSLTTGFINYITTAAEYSAQTYEGGSTLYGPNEGAMFARELGRLSALLAERRVASAPATADSVLVYPGDIRTLVPEKGPPSIERRILQIRCRGDTVVTRWVDLHPSRFRASDGLVLEWQRRVNGGWTRAAVDDDPYVEVRFTGTKRRGGWVWESRWTPPDEPGPYRFMLLPRLGMEGLSSPGCAKFRRPQPGPT